LKSGISHGNTSLGYLDSVFRAPVCNIVLKKSKGFRLVAEAKRKKKESNPEVIASHQSVQGLIPRPGVICDLSLLLVLVLAPRVFLQVLRFSSLLKTQHF